MEKKLRKAMIRAGANKPYDTPVAFHMWGEDLVEEANCFVQTMGIVEHTDGRVEYVYPPNIKFDNSVEW